MILTAKIEISTDRALTEQQHYSMIETVKVAIDGAVAEAIYAEAKQNKYLINKHPYTEVSELKTA